ncbi:MAG: phosphatidate cytidylyltransferase, partial [Candidatus Helarchaeota archaeon]|nr:phosphatidate cytidylyltransferase [Candidatus Helarchaeota archaeon]
ILLALFWIVVILLFTDAVRIKKYRYYPIKMLAKVYRDKERAVLAPHVYLSVGCLFVVFLSDAIDNLLGVSSTISAQIVIMTVMISALADAVATIVGVTKGKHHLKGGKSKKTWEGLIAGFISAILLGLLSYLALMSQYGGSFIQGLFFSLIGATVFTLIDYFSPPIPISDNILNPLAIGLTLWGVWFLFYF